MRDIKFRAWYVKEKRFITWDEIINREFEEEVEHPREFFNGTMSDVMCVQQYIGMRDKKGKEIYEGDICRIPAEDGGVNVFVVKWGIARRDMKSGWKVDIPCFYFDLLGGKFKAFPIVKNFKGVHDLTMLEIIGNIYEDKDMLEDK